MTQQERRSARHDLQREIDSLASEASRWIRRARRQTALAVGVEYVLPAFFLVPIAWIVLRELGPLADRSPLWLPVAMLFFPIAWLAARVFAASRREVAPYDSLAVLDQELGLEDRLLTAAEFIGASLESPFVEAALEDAGQVVARARGAVIELEGERWSPSVRQRWMVSLGLLLMVLAFFDFGSGATQEDTQGPTAAQAGEELALLDTRTTDVAHDLPAPTDREEAPAPEPKLVKPTASTPAAARRDKPGELSEDTKESAGKTGEGRSSDADSTSGASESRGMPSNQSQQSVAPEKRGEKKAPKKKKAKPPAELTPTPKKNEEDDSGSTAGKGSSKGSSKNPAVSKWSSKDQVTTQDDSEIEEDEETEDEEEDQESRGGVQPHLRDRKPPVSRDLRIGFGNAKNPDANGRGGPSEAKKSRGTASLVLGVPIPDRIKGQPNPGKTKITQERIEPKPEEVAQLQADSRSPRETAPGFLRRRELSPWMRTLVREYFLTLRSKRDRP